MSADLLHCFHNLHSSLAGSELLFHEESVYDLSFHVLSFDANWGFPKFFSTRQM